MIGALFSKVAGFIPWKYVVAIGIAIGLFFLVRAGFDHYRTLVNDNIVLKADRTRLTEENALLEDRNKAHIEALERTIKENQRRESDYAENIKIIEGQTNGNACVNSPAVIQSLRLRVERRNAGSLQSQ